jgi:phage FluMu protein Com
MPKCKRCNQWHRWTWLPVDEFNAELDDRCASDGDGVDSLKSEPTDLFHVAQYAETEHQSEPTLTRCGLCGTDRLQVGRASYMTILRCPNCKWETVIHEG